MSLPEIPQPRPHQQAFRAAFNAQATLEGQRTIAEVLQIPAIPLVLTAGGILNGIANGAIPQEHTASGIIVAAVSLLVAATAYAIGSTRARHLQDQINSSKPEIKRLGDVAYLEALQQSHHHTQQ